MRRLVALLAAGALVLSACSGDDETDTTASPETTTTTAIEFVEVDPASVSADPSAGCGGAATTPPGETEHDITSGEIEGTYAQYVPTAHDGDTPVPLVLDLHGLVEGGPIHAAHTQLGPFGDQEGFVTITPDAHREPAQWALQDEGDVTFLSDVLDQVESDLCIDRNRVFSTGLSMGGLMTTVLGCALSDRIAAAAPVAGVGAPPTCARERPVPAVIFYGTEDPVLAYDGGLGAGAAGLPAPGDPGETLGELDADDMEAAMTFLPGAEASAEVWAAGNGCPDAEPTVEAVTDDVERLDYGCAVELYRVVGGGHTWPGSPFDVAIEDIVGPVTMSISANETMWAFFEEHPLGP